MRRARAVEKDSIQITTVKDLTWVFESLASTQVAKVKNKVQMSTEFFKLLWKRYSSIRIDPKKRITNRDESEQNKKQAFVIITAEAGLSGEIDQHLIETMLKDYDSATTDIVVLGSHGANQLTERKIPYVRFFKVPESENYIDVGPVIDAILPYSKTIVYFEEYVSLGVQEIRSINLITSLKDMSEDVDEDVMTAGNTIFEPSLDEIADEMEVTMMKLALSQTILESSLAQEASRFNAMAIAKKRATEILGGYQLEYHRAKRSENDRRMREVMVSLKEKRKRQGARA
ncbi:MAG: F0F1 ATP synthase subunit gamma [Candidatus Saccharibacteria bacterium]|nr:F0F1 ATP synthase subunit gamma [Candidatus Saccharibacteria bacterium]